MARWSENDLARTSANIREQLRTPLRRDTPARGRRGKYGNDRTVVDGITFDSKLEARRYGELKLLEKAGTITNLRVHHPWYLHVKGVEIGYYRDDFNYTENGKPVIEDAKGMLTSLYNWKKRHVFAEYGIKIKEIRG